MCLPRKAAVVDKACGKGVGVNVSPLRKLSMRLLVVGCTVRLGREPTPPLPSNARTREPAGDGCSCSWGGQLAPPRGESVGAAAAVPVAGHPSLELHPNVSQPRRLRAAAAAVRPSLESRGCRQDTVRVVTAVHCRQRRSSSSSTITLDVFLLSQFWRLRMRIIVQQHHPDGF